MSEQQLPEVPQAWPLGAYRSQRNAIDAAIARVLGGGRYVLAEEVRRFEVAFAEYVGVACGVGVASGTDAIEIALRACGVQPGHPVFIPAFTAPATAAAVDRTGARIVLVDIDAGTLTMDPEALAFCIARSSRDGDRAGSHGAVVPVHLFGCPADMPAIMEIARQQQLVVVEDCCQAHGARIGERRVGTFGDAAAFSFYPTKNLGCFGDGGMIVTAAAEVSGVARQLRQYGWKAPQVSAVRGLNSRLDELHAAVLSVLLPQLESRNEARRQVANAYGAALRDRELRPQACPPGNLHAYHQFVVRTPARVRLQAALRTRQVQTAIHYPVPIHRQPAFSHAELPGTLIESERAAAEILSLPMFPELTANAVDRVCAVLRAWPASVQPVRVP